MYRSLRNAVSSETRRRASGASVRRQTWSRSISSTVIPLVTESYMKPNCRLSIRSDKQYCHRWLLHLHSLTLLKTGEFNSSQMIFNAASSNTSCTAINDNLFSKIVLQTTSLTPGLVIFSTLSS